MIERIWPALKGIDGSSGALGMAVNTTVRDLVPLVAKAPASEQTRAAWLERLWLAIEKDGVDYLAEVSAHWGELCASPAVARQWAERLLPELRQFWSRAREPGVTRHFRGASACLSCRVASGRYVETLELIETAPYLTWHYRRFGVEALAASGRADEAIAYARESVGFYDQETSIAATCERILLDAGRTEDAYRDWARSANAQVTHLATFRAISKKYPHKSQSEILADLIQQSAGHEGCWFTTAKSLGQLELAAELAQRSPCNLKTLNRAAETYLDSHPQFALDVAFASLRWFAAGFSYDHDPLDAVLAIGFATKAAQTLGRFEDVRADLVHRVQAGELPGLSTGYYRQMLDRYFLPDQRE